MKTIMTVLAFLLCLVTASLSDVKVSLSQQILQAIKSEDSLTFNTEKNLREITFYDEKSRGQPPEAFPFVLKINKTIMRLDHKRQKYKITIQAARKEYLKHATSLIESNIIPDLQIVISRHTNDQLLQKILETLPNKGKSSVWIWYDDIPTSNKDPKVRRRPASPNK